MLRNQLLRPAVFGRKSSLACARTRLNHSDAVNLKLFPDEEPEQEQKEQPTASKPPKPVRGVKLPPRDQRFVILSAKSSRILPRLKPKPITQQKLEFKSEQLEAQLKRLLVFKSEVPLTVVLTSIEQLKPTTDTLSVQRYDQLFNDILRAYTVPQLREFLRQHTNLRSVKSLRKQDLVKRIITDHWNLKKSKEISESSDLIVENSLPFTSRELFILMAGNGHYLRQWTKSGAKIVILGDEQKIIIRSTADTFGWIDASINKVLDSISTKVFDMKHLKEVVDIENIPLDKIQRMSDVYIEKDGNKLVASALGTKRIYHAMRLILGSSGFSPRRVYSHLFDASENNLTKGSFFQVIEDDSLSWKERSKQWSRWRFNRRKPTPEEISDIDLSDIFSKPSKKKLPQLVATPDTPSFKLLQPKNGILEDVPNISESSVSESYASSIASSIVSTFGQPSQVDIDDSNVTVTATFGYLLHGDVGDFQSNIPQTLANKDRRPLTTFSSNIPYVSEFARTLPLFHTSVEAPEEFSDELENLDSNISLDKSESKPATRDYFAGGKSVTDAIGDILDEPSKPWVDEVTDEHSYYVQMQFLPSPFNLSDGSPLKPSAYKDLPPVEIWLEVDKTEKADLSSVNVIAVEKEALTYASIPHMSADVKFSTAQTRFLEKGQHGVSEFLALSALDFSGNVRIHTPNSLKIKLGPDQEPVPYTYQSMLYRKQIDLSYNGQLLQLAFIEGGQVSGHYMEANLVLDSPANKFSPSNVDNLVREAMSFLHDTQNPIAN